MRDRILNAMRDRKSGAVVIENNVDPHEDYHVGRARGVVSTWDEAIKLVESIMDGED